MTIRDFIAATLQEPLKKFRTPIQDAILELMTQALEELHYKIEDLPRVLDVTHHKRLDILDVLAESWGYNIPASANMYEQIDVFSHIAYVNKIRGSIWSIEHCKDLYGGDFPDYVHIETPSYKIFRYSISPYSIDHIYQDAYRNRVGVYELYLRNYVGDIVEFKRFLYDELVASGSKIYILNNLTADIRHIPMNTAVGISGESQINNSYTIDINKNYLRDSDIGELESANRVIAEIINNRSSLGLTPEDFSDSEVLPFLESDIYGSRGIFPEGDNIVLQSMSLDISPCGTEYAIRALCAETGSFTIKWLNNIPNGSYHISYYVRNTYSSNWSLVEEEVSVTDNTYSLTIEMDEWDDKVYTGFKLEVGDCTTPWTDSDQDDSGIYPDIFIRVYDNEGNYVDNNIEYLRTISSQLDEDSHLVISDTAHNLVVADFDIETDISKAKLIVVNGSKEKDYNYQRLEIGDMIYLELESTRGVYSRELVTEIIQEDVVLSLSTVSNGEVLVHDDSFTYLPIRTDIENPSRLYSRATVNLDDLKSISSYQYFIGDSSGTRLSVAGPIDISEESYGIVDDALYIFERVFELV